MTLTDAAANYATAHHAHQAAGARAQAASARYTAEHIRAEHQARTTGAARARAIGDETTAVAAGRRDIARRLIRSHRARGRLEERTVDGRRQIRRTPVA